MAGVGVKISWREVARKLARMEQAGGKLSGLFRDFGEYMKGSLQSNFDAQGRPAKWQPLKPQSLKGWIMGRKSFWNKKGTQLSKKGVKAMAGRKVLTDTGVLRRSISYRAGVKSLSIFTNIPYAAIHQFGGKAGRGGKATIPARPYLLFQPEDIEYFKRRLAEFVKA